MPPSDRTPLSTTLPPLILGTATFNHQYNHDPYSLPTNELVQQALDNGIRAFDTSPYYGPSEELLGRALSTPYVRDKHPRSSYHVLTKVGRIGGSSFDYSPSWIRKSIRRSLSRLRTDYLDVVYCHDVEFVSPDEVLEAVKELRRIRDGSPSSSPTIRYVGISGYPVEVLVRLAEMVKRETGEPLDAVMSYANFTVQNTRLLRQGLDPLLAAGVDVVPNASLLGMGLLRHTGVPVGALGDFHPAPDGLRDAVRKAGDWVTGHGYENDGNGNGEKKIEAVAIRFAIESWLRDGAPVGASDNVLCGGRLLPSGNKRLGASVMGVSNLDELNETLRIWRSVVNGLDSSNNNSNSSQDGDDRAQQQQQQQQRDRERECSRIQGLAQGIQSVLGPEWVDYVWSSPPPDFVNSLPPDHIAFRDSDDA